MKRAAVQWGIGRYLYDLDVGFATISGEKAEGFTYARTKELALLLEAACPACMGSSIGGFKQWPV
jgi:hypothetical protein